MTKKETVEKKQTRYDKRLKILIGMTLVSLIAFMASILDGSRFSTILAGVVVLTFASGLLYHVMTNNTD